VPIFVAIGQSVAEIWPFRFFKMATIRHLGFVVRLLETTHEEQLVAIIVVAKFG